MDTPYQITKGKWKNFNHISCHYQTFLDTEKSTALAFYLVCLRVSRAQDKHVGKVLGMTGAVEPAVHGNLKDESNGSKGYITFASWSSQSRQRSTLTPEIQGTKYHECSKRHALPCYCSRVCACLMTGIFICLCTTTKVKQSKRVAIIHLKKLKELL